MKTVSLKFKIIAFAVFSVIGAGIVVNTTIKNNAIQNSDALVVNNKTKLTANKSEEIEKQIIKENEIKKQQQIKQKQEDLEKKWKIGYDQFFKKEYKLAIETERQVIKEDPNFYKAYAVEGIALAYNKDFIKGIEQIDQALKLKPNYGYARFNKALANELYGHYDEAIKWYKKALEVEKFEWSYYGIASIYGRKGVIKNTINYLKLAIDINPNVKNEAKNEKDFDNVRDSIEFRKLIEK